jgi:hypothetical protein
LSFALLVLGNDGSATSTPAGGIQLTREPRISMEKERLTISKSKITVEYEFLNTSDRDITTEVAFPVPPYQWGPEYDLPAIDDFRVWVAGQPVKYQTEAKALLKDKDYSAILRELGVDVATFGHIQEFVSGDSSYITSPDIQKLSRQQQDSLVRLGLADKDDKGVGATWTLAKTYHWRQTFPAHKVVNIRHAYKPVVGIGYAVREALQNRDPEVGFEVKLSTACVDAPLHKTLLAGAKPDEEYFKGIRAYWVDYILTTANTWKTPIKDFELVIERPKASQPNLRQPVLGWQGRAERCRPLRRQEAKLHPQQGTKGDVFRGP